MSEMVMGTMKEQDCESSAQPKARWASSTGSERPRVSSTARLITTPDTTGPM